MSKTPDRHPGILVETEEILLGGDVSGDPTDLGGMRYVSGAFRFMDAIGVFDPRGTGSGDVVGPASATDNAIARYDLTTGKLIQNSSATVDDNGYIDNAQGRFNGVRYYTSSATDPSSPTPADGDIYWNTALEKEMRYDGTRSKWLSVESVTFLFNSPQAAIGSYFKLGDVTMTSTRGYNMPHNATLVAMGVTRSNTGTATLEAVAAGSSLATQAIGTATKVKTNTVNADIAVDVVLSAKNASASANEILNGIGYFVVKWRV